MLANQHSKEDIRELHASFNIFSIYFDTKSAHHID